VRYVFRRWPPPGKSQLKPWDALRFSGGWLLIDSPLTLTHHPIVIVSQEELIHVGQPNAALQALHDVITSKRHRTWQKVLEQIMFKYVELCIQLKKGRLAKDGLIQYRIVCQQVNVQSLEEVIKHFLKLATEKAESAQAAAAASANDATLAVSDLEAENTPENLMLKSVSAESEKERSDRETVTPWFKFLWETYRTILEILRNNNKLEPLYAMTANRAFAFCVTHKRTTEFRRLCEILRNHLSNLMKYRDQRDRPDLTLPETQQYYLETRFEQLKAAAQLELWQEAFRTIEDIHGLTIILKRTPNPKMMATYFAKLTKVFWVSENYLYHAYAWYKLFNLSKTYNRNLTPEDLKAMASTVLLSAVAIPPYESRTAAAPSNQELDNAKERDVRMATLLGYTLDPKRDPREVLSRKALLNELIAKGILSLVSTEARQVWALFEKEFHPLDMCKHAQTVFATLSPEAVQLSAASPIPTIEFSQFLPRMRSLAVVRMLQQSSQVYQTMKLETLQRVVPFLEFSQVERILVDATKGGAVAVRLDHQNKCVRFEGDQLESDNIKNHLVAMAQKLKKGMQMMYPEAPAASLATRTNTAELLSKVENEHKMALARKVIIERRKEEQERIMQEQERILEEARVAAQRLHEETEAKRLEEERRTREAMRIRQEMEEKEKEEALALIAEAEKRNKGKKGFKIKLEEGQKLDKRTLMEDAIKEQIKERQEMERKLVRLAKSMDHLERAKREEEVPLIEAAYKVKMAEDEQLHQELQLQNAEKHRKSWETNVEEKKRLAKMGADKDSFAEAIVERRSEEFEALRIAREEKINELRTLRKNEREVARRRAYMRRLQQIEEDDKAAKEEEERERRMAEEREREAARREEEEQRRASERDAPRRDEGRSGGDRGGDRYEPRRGDDRGGSGRYEPRRGDDRYGGSRYDSGRSDDRYGSRGGDSRDSGRYEPRRGGDSRYDSRDSRGGDSRYEPRRDDRDRPSGDRYEPRRGGSGGGGGSRW
jgi:translation initiation factor 3 subunit A